MHATYDLSVSESASDKKTTPSENTAGLKERGVGYLFEDFDETTPITSTTHGSESIRSIALDV